MDVHLEHEYFFNPDGTGKVQLRWSGPPGGPEVDPRTFIGEEVGKAKGVEAWSDVAYGPEDGRQVFRGTAYFRNVSELRFHCQGMHVSSTDFAAAVDEKGTFTVVGKINSKPDEPVVDPAALPAAIEEARAQMKFGREFIDGMFGGLVCSVILRMPGKIKAPKNAKKLDDSSAATEMKGQDLLAILDRLMTDDALMGEMIQRGGGPEAIASLLGDLGPAEVSTKGKTAPLFDYEVEVATAAAIFEEFRAALGVPAGPERSKPAENTRVVAAKIVREADGDRELTPMGQNYPSLSYVLVGDLPGPALKAEEGRLEAFILDDGTDLLPAEDWDRRIHFPKLTKDGRTLICEVEVKLPDIDLTGIREIRGVVRVQIATATEDVDLGFPELATGAQGTMFDAALERCETGEDGRTSVDIRLNLAMERIQSLALVDENGSAAELNRGGYSSSGDQCTLNLDSDAALVPGMKLKARVMADLKYYEVPFGVENVDLLGRPPDSMKGFLDLPYRLPFAAHYREFDAGFYVDFPRQLKIMGSWLRESGCRRTLDIGAMTGGCIEYIRGLGIRMDGTQFTPDVKRLAAARLRKAGVPSTLYVSPVHGPLRVPGRARYDGAVALGWFNLPFTTTRLRGYLAAIRRLLTPGGVFLFDFFEFRRLVVPPTEAVELGGGLVHVSHAERRGSTLRRHHLWISDDGLRAETGDLVDRSPAEARRELARAGFAVVKTRHLDFHYPREFWMARKTGI